MSPGFEPVGGQDQGAGKGGKGKNGKGKQGGRGGNHLNATESCMHACMPGIIKLQLHAIMPLADTY